MNFKGVEMKVLLVDLSHYPYAYFPQLERGMDVDEYHEYNYEEYDNTFFETYHSFPEEKLYGFSDLDDLLTAFCLKIGYDYFDIV